MADREWYTVPGEGQYPNLEQALEAARERAKTTDRTVEIYRETRQLVRCYQREITVKETLASSDVSKA